MHETLNSTFRHGTPPSEPLEGMYPGKLVTPTTWRVTDPLVRAIAHLWMPWLGKRFYPASETVKIDYDSPDNPGFLLRNILDELVEVGPGEYLGKVLLRRRDSWRLVGYFSLRSP